MPKRKRSEPSYSLSNDAPTTDRTLGRQRKLCSQRIEAAEKALLSALRLGAGFERQKYSRRKKTAKDRKDDKAIARLDAEYAVLKSLDLQKLAEQHLRKTIAKVKSLKDNEALPMSVKEIEKGEKDAATLNVTARLYKVDAVKKAVDEAIDELKEVLGAASRVVKVDKSTRDDTMRKKTRLEDDEDEREEHEGLWEDFSDLDSEVLAAFDARIAAPSSGEESSDELSEGERPPSIGDSQSEEEGEFELGEESESGNESGEGLAFHKFSTEDEDEDEDASSEAVIEDDLESEVDSDSDSDSVSIPMPKSKTKAPKSERPSSSTFLPSLSHAAYYSGSESEASDLDAEFAPPKKNRRGQRARQKIWEQKYGDKAKHVGKQDRNKGWDPKKGAVSDSKGGKRGNFGKGSTGGAPRGMKTGYGPERSGENATPLGQRKPKRDDVGQLHPSWLAAKAAKEKKIPIKIDVKESSRNKVVFD